VYLGQKTGKFWPASIADQAEVMQWLMFQVGGFGPMPGQVHHFLALSNEEDRRYGLERFQAETRRLYGVMDRHLAKRRWFAKELSVADFAILGWVWRHARHRVDLADFPSVTRWYAELMGRPGVHARIRHRAAPGTCLARRGLLPAPGADLLAAAAAHALTRKRSCGWEAAPQREKKTGKAGFLENATCVSNDHHRRRHCHSRRPLASLP